MVWTLLKKCAHLLVLCALIGHAHGRHAKRFFCMDLQTAKPKRFEPILGQSPKRESMGIITQIGWTKKKHDAIQTSQIFPAARILETHSTPPNHQAMNAKENPFWSFKPMEINRNSLEIAMSIDGRGPTADPCPSRGFPQIRRIHSLLIILSLSHPKKTCRSERPGTQFSSFKSRWHTWCQWR